MPIAESIHPRPALYQRMIVTVLAFLVTATAVQAAPEAYESDLIARAASAFGGAAGLNSLGGPGGTEVVKCATSLVFEIKMNWPNLTPATRTKLSGLAIFDRPVLSEYYDFDTRDTAGHFRIHYSRTGDNAVNMSFGVGPGNVPNYVLRCAALMDTVVHEEITTLGYQFPVSDHVGRAAEDPRFDIYLVNLGPKFYGLTNPDTLVYKPSPGIYMVTSYMELSNDYTQLPGYQSRPFDAMAVTLAHEFFHSIQWTYDAEEAEYRDNTYYSWFNELSATWMEDAVFDRVNDFYSYLPNFFHYPWISLRVIGNGAASFPDQFHPYAACLWGKFLEEKYQDRSVMRDIWERCGSRRGFNTFDAFDFALVKRGSSFRAAWAEFLVWNYFTGDRTRSWSYQDGAEFAHPPGSPDFDGKISDTLVAHYSSYPAEDSTRRNTIPRRTDELGAAYLSFTPPVSDTAVSFNFQLTPDNFQQWMVVTAGIRPTGKPAILESSDVFHPITLPDWTSYDEVLVIVSPFKQTPAEGVLDRELTFHYAVQDTLSSNEDVSTKAYPNPLVLTGGSTAESFQVDVLLPNPLPVSMFIYTVDGQLVRGAPDEGMSFAAGTPKAKLIWNGTNRNGKTVASGVYLALLRIGERKEVIKVAVRNER